MADTYAKSYSKWLNGLIPIHVDEELKTCEPCAMVNPSGLTRDPGPFHPEQKCCNYFPFIPNFSLGALLASEDTEIRTRLEVAINQGALTPLGLFARQTEKQPKVCPFFHAHKRECSIWAHRPGVCSSYFCQSSRAEEGFAFWRKMEEFVNTFEWSFAHDLLFDREIGFTLQETQEMETARRRYKGTGAVPGAWFEWQSKEREFIKKTSLLASSKGSADVKVLLGESGAHAAKELAKELVKW